MAISRQPDRDAGTIAAIATPPGAGGIGIIRISGPDSLALLHRLFRPQRAQELRSHQLTYGWIIDPASGRLLDEVMAVRMAAPHSYTREDVVEIQCHSSYLILQQILGLVLAEGALPAEPGEFTKRAFLNGRIDLTRAEAVIDLLQAQTSQGLQIAISQLRGTLQDRVEAVRQELLGVRALLEVAIDFPDDDLEILNPANLLPNLADQVIAPLAELLLAADRGRIYREGISVVILGRPNVGKSSLLNSLLKEERAIVTEIPGTTRDTIEDFLNIKGMPVRIVDTAGIRENAEAVEELGIQRARRKQAAADLVLLVLDGAVGVQDDDLALIGSLAGRPTLLVVNKIDLCLDRDLSPFAALAPGLPVVGVSARTGEGLSQLEEVVFTTVTGGAPAEPEHYCVPNARHRLALQGALDNTRQLATALENGLPPDLAAIEVQGALDQLGEIVGETSSEDLLDAIFSRFCLGK
jgi:tRNA modification GTPase